MGSTLTFRSSFLSPKLRRLFSGVKNILGEYTSARHSSSLDSMSLDDVEKILNRSDDGNSRQDERMKALKLEYDFFFYMGNAVPQIITDDMWERLLEAESGEARRNLWELYSRRESAGDLGVVMRRRMAQYRVTKMMHQVKNVENENFDGRIYDDSGRNKAGAPQNILPRINANYVKQRYNSRAMQGVLFGQNIVFDLGLPCDMGREDEVRFNMFMRSIYCRNRCSWDPFNIHLCNYNPENPALRRLIEDKGCESYLWNVTTKCFTNVFPREKIVYLSPKAKTVLKEFSHDDIYVIGAIGDSFQPRCHVKAKELKVRSARLDLDPYFVKTGKQNFRIKEIFRILLDAKDTDGNWLYSLRHLSTQTMRVLKWRAKYEFMEDYEEESSMFQNTFQSMTEEFTEIADPIFTNERAILKPRNNLPKSPAVSSRYESDDGPIDIDRNWKEFEFDRIMAINSLYDDDKIDSYMK